MNGSYVLGDKYKTFNAQYIQWGGHFVFEPSLIITPYRRNYSMEKLLKRSAIRDGKEGLKQDADVQRSALVYS